jgi:predicted RNA-binding protein YlxR (DUF448 family)
MGCRKRDDKVFLVRIAACNDSVTVDLCFEHPTRSFGRGGYLHARQPCLESFVKMKTREFRSLRRPLDREERLRLSEMIGSR